MGWDMLTSLFVGAHDWLNIIAISCRGKDCMAV